MKTHQIMGFIGNGFDISALRKYGKGIITSYDSFYSFFKYKYPDKTDNLLISQMECAKQQQKENWSDFEEILNELLNNLSDLEQEKINQLSKDLNEIQQAFSRFLNDVVDSDVINNISKATDITENTNDGSSDKHCSSRTLKGAFFEDLSKIQYENMNFHNRLDNNEQLKYIFINFNYTSLLDNYLYIDQTIDPEPYKTSNNNIVINANPNKYKHIGFYNPYMQLLPIDIFHPHGIQDVPKSLLFGIENEHYINTRDKKRVFVKAFWSRSQLRYNEQIEKTELFIIYGCSIGKSDNWWWRKIYKKLTDKNPAELIIYNYGDVDEDIIKEKFIHNCCLENENNDDIKKAKENIYVINFGSQANKDAVFMSLPEQTNENL